MSVSKNPLELDEEENKTVVLGGESGVSTAAPAGAAPGISAGSSPLGSASGSGGPGGFVNLDKYLAVNEAEGKTIAKGIGDKAVGNLADANKNLSALTGSIAGDVAKGAVTDTVSQGLRSNPQALDKAAVDRAAKGYLGPNDLGSVNGYANFESAYNKGLAEANKYTNADYQKATLDEMYNTSENKSKIGGYTSGMRGLDQALVTGQSQLIKSAVDSAAGDINNKKSAAQKDFEKQRDNAIKTSNDAWNTIKTTASDSQKALKSANDAEIASKNSANDSIWNKYAAPVLATKTVNKGAGASYGDVVDEQEAAAARNLEYILKNQTFDNMNKTFAGASVVDNTPMPIPSLPSNPTNPGAGRIPPPGTIAIPLPIGDENDRSAGPYVPGTVTNAPVVMPGSLAIPLPVMSAPASAPASSGGNRATRPSKVNVNKYYER